MFSTRSRLYFYRMVHELLSKPVIEIVRDNYRTADVFDRHGISYCCGGNTELAKACETRELDPLQVGRELEDAVREIRLPGNIRFSAWSQDFVASYLQNIHHSPLMESLPLIDAQLRHFAHSHVNKMPFLADLLETFEQLAVRLTDQTRYEDETIFPYIRLLDAAIRGNETYGPLFVRTLRKPMAKSPDTQEAILLFARMRELTNDYQLPEKSCTTNRVVYQKLAEMDRDFSFHNWLEQIILFPRAIEAEQQLLRQ